MLRNDILTVDGIIDITEIAGRYNLESDVVKEVIDELLAETLLEGKYSKDRKKFLTISHIIHTIKAKL